MGSAIVIACLLTIFILLCTTPADALKLPRGISECIIVAGSLPRHFHSSWLAIHLGIVVVILIILRLWRQSPWWVVLFAWA